MKASKGQVTLDLMVAILISLFLFTWIQSYIGTQAGQTQEMGINQELQRKTVALGTVMNNYYALSPESNDYSALINSEIKNMVIEPNVTITKQSADTQLTVTVDYGGAEDQATYTYKVPQGITYDSECAETGGEPCVK